MSSTPTLAPGASGRTRGSEAKPWLIFLVAGAVLILAGGFVAAAGGEDPSKHLSWAAAYLVLVCGAAQLALGGGRALMVPRQLGTTLITWQFITFNLGNAGVLVGTLTGATAALYVGSAVLLVALALFAWDVRNLRPRHRGVIIYWVLALVLAVSIPIGGVLGH